MACLSPRVQCRGVSPTASTYAGSSFSRATSPGSCYSRAASPLNVPAGVAWPWPGLPTPVSPRILSRGGSLKGLTCLGQPQAPEQQQRPLFHRAQSHTCLGSQSSTGTSPRSPRPRCHSDPTPRSGGTAGGARGSNAGTDLRRVIAPGDVLFVRGTGGIQRLGTTGGVMGHVLVAVAPPKSILRHSPEGKALRAAWPAGDVSEIWRVHTLESTRRVEGLHQADMLLYIEPNTRQLLLAGEVSRNWEELGVIDAEAVEVWQSPKDLRHELRPEAIAQVLAEMTEGEQQSWSFATAARAVFMSAGVPHALNKEQLMEQIRAAWAAEPICTSVVISFWQRYLCKVAQSKLSSPVDPILRWMPLRADRVLPGDLLRAMQSSGWVHLSRVPRVV